MGGKLIRGTARAGTSRFTQQLFRADKHLRIRYRCRLHIFCRFFCGTKRGAAFYAAAFLAAPEGQGGGVRCVSFAVRGVAFCASPAASALFSPAACLPPLLSLPGCAPGARGALAAIRGVAGFATRCAWRNMRLACARRRKPGLLRCASHFY